MDWDPVLVIAQIITGVATLIVASVLIWQMFLQRRSLQIAHSDADNNLSMQAISQKSDINRWFQDKLTSDFREKLDDGLKALNQHELDIFRTVMLSLGVLANTEWRLGRVDGNPNYYRKFIAEMLRTKAGVEYYKNSGRDFFIEANYGDPMLVKLGDEAYEEALKQDAK